jgi:hypothetical protein
MRGRLLACPACQHITVATSKGQIGHWKIRKILGPSVVALVLVGSRKTDSLGAVGLRFVCGTMTAHFLPEMQYARDGRLYAM